MEFLKTTIEYLKGVGPLRAETLNKEAKIFTFNDLLHYFPFRYVDRSVIHAIADVPGLSSDVQIKGTITKVNEIGAARKKRLVAVLKDDSGSIELVWFKGIKWVKPTLVIGKNYLVYGKANQFGSKWNIAHPDIDRQEAVKIIPGMLQPIYHSGEKLTAKGLNTRGFEKILRHLLVLSEGKIVESIPDQAVKGLQLISRDLAYQNIHQPKNSDLLKKAVLRLKFEELFFLQLAINKQKITTQRKIKGYTFDKVAAYFNQFYNDYLPFELTGAQKKVVKEIRKDLGSSMQMNRLLQGDVGSGKTLVAVLSILIAIDNGYQACLMAPTEILAIQHYQTVVELLGEMGVTVKLLTGSASKKEREEIHRQLLSGSLSILVGTHAILEDVVQFKNLGLAIIDEQHRFGVAQRSKLWKKNNFPPHILVMTATPIPRTLAMTFYGDLDVSIIDELPPGRKQIKTMWKTDSSRLQIINFMREQIALQRQIYVVFPLIEESEKLDYKDLMEGYNAIEREFPLPEFQVSVVHGQMKAEDKEYEMKRFLDGVTNIMVATTVIEVGVNVPNASVMIIESAERFGLSQLHQLRGRVGRGAEQSYCILVSGNKVSVEGKTRLKTMVDTNDGFKISEVDLELRGPGDMMGTKQSGVLDFKIADIIMDNKILHFARNEANLLLKEDEDLEKVENINIARAYRPYARERMGWSRIS